MSVGSLQIKAAVVDKPFDRPVPKPAPPEAFLLSIVLAARSSA